MKYAIITSGGKQYKVIEGQTIEVDKIKAEAGDTHAFSNVLLTVDEGNVQIGAPYLDGVSVSAKVVAQVKGDKVRVAKFKAKARYRKVQGFRAQLTQVEIAGWSQKSEKKTAPKK